jgi:ribosome-binding factor A
MCQILGLRYAPEIRFYRDNTINQYEEQKAQALQYLEDIKKEKENSPEV